MPEPSVFCTMTAALVCRRSQVPGTAPVPYRRHRQRTAALGVLSRPSFSGEPCERPPGAGQLVRLGRLPISFIPCILRGRGGDSKCLLASQAWKMPEALSLHADSFSGGGQGDSR